MYIYLYVHMYKKSGLQPHRTVEIKKIWAQLKIERQKIVI
jgi:hypothetical protein